MSNALEYASKIHIMLAYKIILKGQWLAENGSEVLQQLKLLQGLVI